MLLLCMIGDVKMINSLKDKSGKISIVPLLIGFVVMMFLLVGVEFSGVFPGTESNSVSIDDLESNFTQVASKQEEYGGDSLDMDYSITTTNGHKIFISEDKWRELKIDDEIEYKVVNDELILINE